jgi:hypothetical protein
MFAPPSQAADGAYEPNDSALSAGGPLLLGNTYTAALEAQGDRDLFAFHMTSPPLTQAELTVTNLGGGEGSSDFSVTVFDAAASPVAGESYVRAGQTRTLVVYLRPQKYYVEVATGEGFGDSYSLATRGGDGAFGPYDEIAARCGAAKRGLAVAEIRLNRAEAKRQRVLARTRRARYAGAAARRSARVAFRKARKRLKSKRRAARKAARRREPWCSIAQ